MTMVILTMMVLGKMMKNTAMVCSIVSMNTMKGNGS